MQKHNESQLNLRFLKTFALAAEQMVMTANCDEPQKAQFSSYAKTLSEVYPALENLAWELKLHYHSDIQIPEIEETETYEKSAAFPVLAKAVADDMNKRFSEIRSWYDGSSETVPQQLEAAIVNMQASVQHSKNNYWLYNSLKLSLGEIKAKRLELQQQMYDEIDNRMLPQQVAGVMESQGFNVSDEQDDEIAEILCEVGEVFLSENKQADSEEVTLSVWERLQESWEITDIEQRILYPLVKPMESFGRIIRGIQRKVAVWDSPVRYLEKQLKNMGNIPGDEAIRQEIYRINVVHAAPSVPLGKTWDDGEALPDYLEPYQDDERFQKVNSQSRYWKEYERQGEVLHSPEWQEKFQAVIGDWSLMLKENIDDFKNGLVRRFEEDKKRREAAEDGDILPPVDAEYEQRQKEESLIFANKLVVAARAAEKYAGVVLNDSGVSQKTLAKISCEKNWSKNDYQALYLVAEAFENNYDRHQQELSVSAEGDNEEFLEKFLALPHSPEKREIMNLMLLNFGDQKLIIDGEIECLSNDFVGLIEEQQVAEFEQMQDFLQSGIEAYPEMGKLNAEKVAEDISYGLSGSYIIPLYLSLKPYPDAKERMLSEIDGYENFSVPAQEYLDGLASGYLKVIVSKHQKIKETLGEVWSPNAGSLNDENPMANIITDYKSVLLREMDLAQNAESVQNAYEGENALYHKYLDYREQRESFNISDKSLQMMLMKAQSFRR